MLPIIIIIIILRTYIILRRRNITTHHEGNIFALYSPFSVVTKVFGGERRKGAKKEKSSCLYSADNDDFCVPFAALFELSCTVYTSTAAATTTTTITTTTRTNTCFYSCSFESISRVVLMKKKRKLIPIYLSFFISRTPTYSFF